MDREHIYIYCGPCKRKSRKKRSVSWTVNNRPVLSSLISYYFCDDWPIAAKAVPVQHPATLYE